MRQPAMLTATPLTATLLISNLLILRCLYRHLTSAITMPTTSTKAPVARCMPRRAGWLIRCVLSWLVLTLVAGRWLVVPWCCLGSGDEGLHPQILDRRRRVVTF